VLVDGMELAGLRPGVDVAIAIALDIAATQFPVAHLAAGWGADIVKVGSIARGERTAKWNELIRIDEACGGLPLAAPLRAVRRAD